MELIHHFIQREIDIQEALKDLLGGTLQAMLETEIEQQMRKQKEEDPNYHDSRNGYKDKTLRSSMGEIPIQVPQDRNSDFEPIVVPKYQKNITEIEGKIIGMYARGLSTRQISDQIEDIYGFTVSEGMVTGITNKLPPEIETWQKTFPLLLTRDEAAKYMGIPLSALDRVRQTEGFPIVRMSNRLMIHREKLDEWLHSQMML